MEMLNNGKIYKKILCIPDLHAPFLDMKLLKIVGQWAKNHKPDLVVLLGDLMDQKAWGRWPKDADDYSPHDEFEYAVTQLNLVNKLFPEAEVLLGNHDLRILKRISEVGLPSHVIRELDEVLGYENWNWHTDPKKKLIVNTPRGPIWFCHGDEMGGTVAAKSRLLGISVVSGHGHQASITYSKSLNHFVFGMECGMLMDVDSKGAKYAAKSGRFPVEGFGVIKYGIPYFIPVTGKEKKI